MNHRYGYILFPGAVLLVFSTAVALATPSWIYFGIVTKSYEGLWKRCIDKSCTNIQNVESYVKVVRAFLIMATLVEAVAVVLGLLVAGSKFPSKRQIITSIGLTLCMAGSCLSQLIAMIVFTSEHSSSQTLVWGYSFVVGWFSTSLNVVLTAVAVFGVFKEEDPFSLDEF